MKKRFLIILLCLISFTLSAQTQWYNSNSYAYKHMNSYGYWSQWTEWISCNVNIKFDLSYDRIIIYSNKTQYYKIISYEGQKYDDSGGQQAYFKAIDGEGDRCSIRLRMETNGNSQIYVEFANVMWVYNVIRYE